MRKLIWLLLMLPLMARGQINTDRVMTIARNALSYSITMVTIQENQVMSRLIMMSLYLQTSLRRLRLRSRCHRRSLLQRCQNRSFGLHQESSGSQSAYLPLPQSLQRLSQAIYMSSSYCFFTFYFTTTLLFMIYTPLGRAFTSLVFIRTPSML